jgi:hypothetical protein
VLTFSTRKGAAALAASERVEELMSQVGGLQRKVASLETQKIEAQCHSPLGTTAWALGLLLSPSSPSGGSTGGGARWFGAPGTRGMREGLSPLPVPASASPHCAIGLGRVATAVGL